MTKVSRNYGYQLLVCLSLCAGFSLAPRSVSAAEVWDGSVDTLWYGHSHFSFTLHNAKQLAGLAALVNEGNSFHNITIYLEDDIVLNDASSHIWTPIGTPSNPFAGTLDGRGHTISGLYTITTEYGGLFGRIKEGTIRNLVVKNFNIEASQHAGSIAGMVDPGTVEQCYVTETTVTGHWHTGGIVGYNTGTVSGCFYTGVVSGRPYGSDANIGGIVGYNTDKVLNCHSAGTVSGTNGDGHVVCVGGVVGSNSYGTLDECDNTATVNGTSSVGGVTGDNSRGTITNCFNTGTVTATYTDDTTNNSIRIGGLSGVNDGTVDNCYNTGSVSGAGNDVGGIIGFSRCGQLTNCYHAGTLIETAGGLVGRSNATITYCYWNSDLFTGNGILFGNLGEGCSGYGTAYMQSSDFLTLLNAHKPTYQTWKAVSGGYPTFDRNGLVFLQTADFYRVAGIKDLSVTVVGNGNTLNSITLNEQTKLQEGRDYDISGMTVTIKKSFIENLPDGTAKLAFGFSGGNNATLSITVKQYPFLADENGTNEADTAAGLNCPILGWTGLGLLVLGFMGFHGKRPV